MPQDNANAELDPELAALLGPAVPAEAVSDLDAFLGAGDPDANAAADDGTEDENAADVDLASKDFPEITKRLADVPAKVFD